MRLFVPLTALLVAACQSAPEEGTVTTSPTEPFGQIAASETVHYTGTEPFWGGAAAAGMATYSTPENPDGSEFAVERFAGNNGISFSGKIDGKGFDLTVTPGACSDGMSDRSYPFTATLLIGQEQRQGCAWTDSQPFSGPAAP